MGEAMKKYLLFILSLVLLLSLFSFVGCKRKHECVYTAHVTPPTCTEQGYTTYKCECGQKYIDNYTQALGHALEYHDAKTPTHSEVGWYAYEACTREGCGYTTYQERPKTRGGIEFRCRRL